jgi:SagB-type dehydrogenase family enzyme
MTAPAVRSRLRLCSGVQVARADDGLVLRRGLRQETIGIAAAAILRRLATDSYTDEDLRADHRTDLSAIVDRLWQRGWLSVTTEHERRPLLVIEPLGPIPQDRGARPTWRPSQKTAPAQARLSRFAVLRRDEDRLILESPCSPVVITALDPIALLVIWSLAGPTSTPGGHAAVPAHLRVTVIGQLADCGFTETHGSDSKPEPGWAPHELWFHARSRWSRDHPVTTAKNAGASPSARHPGFGGPRQALARADMTSLRRTEASFTAVVEDRRSLRRFDDDNPLTLAEIGEFLFRCARVRWSGHHGRYELVSRPYPSAGAIHELELYLAITRVAGLASGLYRYCPDVHELERVTTDEGVTRQLAYMAGLAIGIVRPPQALVIISARFERIMWKYRDISYALVLKDAGALMQTMNLVATAMGLAGCGVGSGDSRLFAEATQLDPLIETSVGEFIIGSRRSADDAPGK